MADARAKQTELGNSMGLTVVLDIATDLELWAANPAAAAELAEERVRLLAELGEQGLSSSSAESTDVLVQKQAGTRTSRAARWPRKLARTIELDPRFEETTPVRNWFCGLLLKEKAGARGFGRVLGCFPPMQCGLPRSRGR